MEMKVVTPLLLLLFLKVCLADDTNWLQGIKDLEDTDVGGGMYDDNGGAAEAGDSEEQLEEEKEDEHEKGGEIKDTEEIKVKVREEDEKKEEEEGDGGHAEAHEKAGEEEDDEEQLKDENSGTETRLEGAEAKQTSPDEGRNTPLAFVDRLRRMRWKAAYNDVPVTNLHPTDLRLGKFSSTWANLFWEAPNLPDYIIVANYSVLCFQPEFEHYLQSVSTPGPETTIRLSGLEMGTMYQCDVRAETNEGPSGWSAHLRFYPLPSGLRKLGLAFQHMEKRMARLEKQSAHCAYRGRWILPNSTITYDSVPLSHGLGSFDLASGEWKSEAGGRYVVSWDLYSHLFKGEAVMIRLYRRLAGGINEVHSHRHFSKFEVSSGMTAYDNIREQGGRTKILTVKKGESLFLRTDLFTGEAFRINFCIHLLYAF